MKLMHNAIRNVKVVGSVARKKGILIKEEVGFQPKPVKGEAKNKDGKKDKK